MMLLLTSISTNICRGQFTAALWGDSRSNADNAMEEIAGYLLAEKGKTIDVHWQNGDFTQSGSIPDWDSSWNIPNVREACVKDYFFMCTSNHDCGKHPENYQDQLGDILPSNGKNVYYSMTSWDIPGSHRKVHLLMFDNRYMATEQEQVDYFTARLSETNPDDWIVAMWHFPSFNGMTYKNNEGKEKDTYMQLLESESVGGDFVLSGHAHVYRRSHVMDWDANVLETTGGAGTSHTSPAGSRGLVHIVNGRGGVFSTDTTGANWYGNAFAPIEVDKYGLVTLMTFDDNTMHMRTIRIGDDYKELNELESWTWTRGEPMRNNQNNNK